MHLITIGLNHDSAPIGVREQVAVTAERLEDALHQVADRNQVNEAAILSTCNRTEIYCHQQDRSDDQLVSWLCRFHGVAEADLSPYLYRFPDEKAVRHAFRVA